MKKGFPGAPEDRTILSLAETPAEESPRTQPAAGSGVGKSSGSDLILRFRKSERMLHWAIAAPYMVCYATAMILMIGYNLHSTGTSRQVFSWIHRTAGACLLLLPLVALLRHGKDRSTHFENIRQGWGWTIEDLKWLFLFGAAAVSRKIKLPEQGKFNAAEKINFMMLMCTYPVFVFTGLLLCLPGSKFLTWIIHVDLALLVTPLMIGHIFMAVVNPDTRVGLTGMISGYVDRRWAKHHYGRWYRERFEPDAVPEKAKPAEGRPATAKKAGVVTLFPYLSPPASRHRGCS